MFLSELYFYYYPRIEGEIFDKNSKLSQKIKHNDMEIELEPTGEADQKVLTVSSEDTSKVFTICLKLKEDNEVNLFPTENGIILDCVYGCGLGRYVGRIIEVVFNEGTITLKIKQEQDPYSKETFPFQVILEKGYNVSVKRDKIEVYN